MTAEWVFICKHSLVIEEFKILQESYKQSWTGIHTTCKQLARFLQDLNHLARILQVLNQLARFLQLLISLITRVKVFFGMNFVFMEQLGIFGTTWLIAGKN